jgi:hypothetical protein
VKVLADSHAIIWQSQCSPELSEVAADALLEAEETDGVVVSVASLIDLWYVDLMNYLLDIGSCGACIFGFVWCGSCVPRSPGLSMAPGSQSGGCGRPVTIRR